MIANVNVRSIDMLFLDDLFDMGGGYVLNFKDRTFAQFFAELGIDIDDARYSANGTSKAKRLRYFLTTADKESVVRALEALWEYREVVRERDGRPEGIRNAHDRLLALIDRIGGTKTRATIVSEPSAATPSIDPEKLSRLRSDLIELASVDPQPRGYAFERLLKNLFDAHGLQAREAFRLRGEQIDGSFQLLTDTYLLEAKWQNPRCGAEELHAFHGKVEQKASWARGLFVSNSGFTDNGLSAFGRGKRVICMDGLDLYDVLHRGLSLTRVLERKARYAAETGSPFARVRDLFPD